MAYLDYPGLQRYHGKVQDEIDELKDDLAQIEGISDDVKQALLACFRHVAFLDDDDDYYGDLEDALYPSQPAVEISWDYSLGRLPTSEDGIDFSYSDYTVSFDSNNGIHCVCNTESWDPYVRFNPIGYEYIKEGIIEATIKLSSCGNTGSFYSRMSDNSNYGYLGYARLDQSSTGTKIIYRTTQNGSTVNHVISNVVFNQEYNMKLHYKNNGAVKGYIDNVLVFDTTDKVTSGLPTRAGCGGKIDMYIKSIKYTIIEPIGGE